MPPFGHIPDCVPWLKNADMQMAVAEKVIIKSRGTTDIGTYEILCVRRIATLLTFGPEVESLDTTYGGTRRKYLICAPCSVPISEICIPDHVHSTEVIHPRP